MGLAVKILGHLRIFTFFYVLQGWNQWILVLDVRKNCLGRQGGNWPGFSSDFGIILEIYSFASRGF